MSAPDDPRPPYRNGNGRLGLIAGVADILRSLSLQNMLTLGILVAILIPSYLLWQFVHDDELRKELLSYAIVIDAKVPCAVYRTSLQGQPERYNVIVTYEHDGPFQVGVIVNAGSMSQSEIIQACRMAVAGAKQLRDVSPVVVPPTNSSAPIQGLDPKP